MKEGKKKEERKEKKEEGRKVRKEYRKVITNDKNERRGN